MTKSEFYIETIKICERNLSKPNVRYPNGRMSHDVERKHLAEMVHEFEDYKLERGLFDANFRLVGFDEA